MWEEWLHWLVRRAPARPETSLHGGADDAHDACPRPHVWLGETFLEGAQVGRFSTAQKPALGRNESPMMHSTVKTKKTHARDGLA